MLADEQAAVATAKSDAMASVAASQSAQSEAAQAYEARYEAVLSRMLDEEAGWEHRHANAVEEIEELGGHLDDTIEAADEMEERVRRIRRVAVLSQRRACCAAREVAPFRPPPLPPPPLPPTHRLLSSLVSPTACATPI